MHSLADHLLAHVHRNDLLRAGDRVGVAVSGGIDSVALLRVLLELRGELGIVVSVVHFNHKLRGAESDADQEFVAALAREHDVEFYCDGDDVARHAAEEHVSVESAARELRYGFFRYLLGAKAPIDGESDDRSARSAAPPKGEPQGLKPSGDSQLRGPEGPLFHSNSNGTAEGVPFHKPSLLAANVPAEAVLLHKPSSLRSGLPSPARYPITNRLEKLVTGHTLDDQAETVLMRLIRGAGLRGLGGIHPRIAVENESEEVCGEIVRPLLTIRRRELQQYLNDIGQPWREDSSNADDQFTRNRVRKLVVPLLEREFNPSVAENLAELSAIARGEEDYWENEISGWLGTTVHWNEPDWARASSNEPGLVQIGLPGTHPKQPSPSDVDLADIDLADVDLQSRIDNAPWLVVNASVSRMWLLGEPIAVQRRLVKAISEHVRIPLEFKHVEEILRFAEEDGGGKELSLPQGWKLRREPDALMFITPDLRESSPGQNYETHNRERRNYEYELSIPGRTVIHETSTVLESQRILAGDAGYNPDQLLDIESLPGPLRVRNWRPGDRFWPAHTKSPRKIKELLQERHIAQPERGLWPVVVSGEEIVWMRGFPTPTKLNAKPGHDALLIFERTLVSEAAK